jgi:putative DNA primase/helicase
MIEAEFRAALRAHGLVPPEQIIADGQLHRCDVDGKNGRGDGAYVLHLDGVPAGGFQNWQNGGWHDWCAHDTRTLTTAERKELRERCRWMRAERDAMRAQRQREAADLALKIWADAKSAPPDHPYLLRKQVQPYGLRVLSGSLVVGDMECDGALIVPLRDESGELQSLQFIAADGEKRFQREGRVQGCYHAVGVPDQTIVIAEGYATAASVHEVTGHAIACALNAGNLRAVAERLRRKHPAVRIIIAADNDTLGAGQRSANVAARAVSAVVAMPIEAGMDWNDVAIAHGPDAVRIGIEAATAPAVARPTDWPAPTPLPDGLPPVEAFDYDLLPQVLQRRVADIAERMQCPPDYPAVALLVSLSSLIGRRCGIAPKRADDWIVIPNLWGMIVGRPGVMKSPPLTEIMKPLQVLQARASEDHGQKMAHYEAGAMVAEQAERVAKEAIRKLLKDGKTTAAGERAQEAVQGTDTEPVCRRYVVNDTTVEKLGELLNENPYGLLLHRDGLRGFFAILERQGHEADRAFYVESWNGDGAFDYDRIGRGRVHISGCCLSIIGSIQPGPLSDLVRGQRGIGDDGLVQRFQLAVWPDVSPEWRNVDRAPDVEARDAVQTLIDRLDRMTAENLGDDRGSIPVVRFSEDAQLLFDIWRESLELRLRGDHEHPTLEAHLAKYRSLVPSLALILHLTEHRDGPVEKLALERALAWAEYLETHARRIYAPAICPDVDAPRRAPPRLTDCDFLSASLLSAEDYFRKASILKPLPTGYQVANYGKNIPAEAIVTLVSVMEDKRGGRPHA